VISVPGWAWAATAGTIGCLLVIDLLASRRPPGFSRAAALTAAWAAAGTGFGIVIIATLGADPGQQYFAAYLTEQALSVDNLFIFALLFQSFAVPAACQRRVLLAGVIGALALRGGFIAAGAALIDHLSWALYAFGALLLAAAVRMARGGTGRAPPGGLVLRGLRKVMPVSDDYDGRRFVTRREGKLVATPLLVVLVAVEATDLVFAVDSIPASFGITTNVFIVFTANAFAVLGLRSLYFVLAGAMRRFGYLRQGMTVLLGFIGGKMILAPVLHIPAVVSLGVIVVIIAGSVALSLRQNARTGPRREQPAAPGSPGDQPAAPGTRREQPAAPGAGPGHPGVAPARAGARRSPA
jgi:tellurite resistance protein TerC